VVSHGEEACRRVASNVEQVLSDIVAVLIRRYSSWSCASEVVNGAEPARSGVECAPVCKEKDGVEFLIE
jgi:hypothetical protein